EPKVEAMPEDVVWHFIGHLQSNKAKRVANLFSVLHTVCNEAQLREIGKSNRTGLQVFVEVNIAQEARKSGVDEKNLDEIVKMLLNYSNVQFCGLMTIGPALLEPEGMRDYFRRLRDLNQQVGGKWLSMGMSGDYCVAIQEGSTHVRIGTALFGDRR
ncbi:MAG: YggS family pyridoxal phosphate-dependent enzyme, partial [Fimbriimonas sp.]